MSAIIDMALYAGKTGQMLRLPSIKRSNGLYKVPVSISEVRAVFESDDPLKVYQALCSAPRAENWTAEVNEVAGLGDLLKRLALEAVQKRYERIKTVGSTFAGPVDVNEVLGMKDCDNVADGILHIWPCGGSILQTLGSHPVWSNVARVFNHIGCTHDCLDYAEQKFSEISKAAPNYSGMAAVRKRWNDIDHDKAEKYITKLWIFEQLKGKGFRDSNPTAKGAYKDRRNARDVLAEVVAETDKAKQRAMLLDELTVSAYEACKLSKWNELCAQVDDVAREHHSKREFDNLHKEFKAESGNVTDADLKSDAKFLKWVKTVATFCIDTDGIECIIIEGEAFDLDGGAWLTKLADLWVTTVGDEGAA